MESNGQQQQVNTNTNNNVVVETRKRRGVDEEQRPLFDFSSTPLVHPNGKEMSTQDKGNLIMCYAMEDKFHDSEKDRELDFSVIITMGQQSGGKSLLTASILSLVAGTEDIQIAPSHRGRCTKRPSIICLGDKRGESNFTLKIGRTTCQYSASHEVRQRLWKYFVQELEEKDVKYGLDDAVTVFVKSKSFIQMIDSPGIIATSRGNQPITELLGCNKSGSRPILIITVPATADGDISANPFLVTFTGYCQTPANLEFLKTIHIFVVITHGDYIVKQNVQAKVIETSQDFLAETEKLGLQVDLACVQLVDHDVQDDNNNNHPKAEEHSFGRAREAERSCLLKDSYLRSARRPRGGAPLFYLGLEDFVKALQYEQSKSILENRELLLSLKDSVATRIQEITQYINMIHAPLSMSAINHQVFARFANDTREIINKHKMAMAIRTLLRKLVADFYERVLKGTNWEPKFDTNAYCEAQLTDEIIESISAQKWKEATHKIIDELARNHKAIAKVFADNLTDTFAEAFQAFRSYPTVVGAMKEGLVTFVKEKMPTFEESIRMVITEQKHFIEKKRCGNADRAEFGYPEGCAFIKDARLEELGTNHESPCFARRVLLHLHPILKVLVNNIIVKYQALRKSLEEHLSHVMGPKTGTVIEMTKEQLEAHKKDIARFEIIDKAIGDYLRAIPSPQPHPNDGDNNNNGRSNKKQKGFLGNLGFGLW